MANTAEINDIILKLLERTDQGRVDWEATVNEDVYVAVIGNLSVSLNQDFRKGVTVQILDEQGREIRALSSSSGEALEVSAALGELYSKAKRSALQVDSRLDELLTELTKDN